MAATTHYLNSWGAHGQLHTPLKGLRWFLTPKHNHRLVQAVVMTHTILCNLIVLMGIEGIAKKQLTQHVLETVVQEHPFTECDALWYNVTGIGTTLSRTLRSCVTFGKPGQADGPYRFRLHNRVNSSDMCLLPVATQFVDSDDNTPIHPQYEIAPEGHIMPVNTVAYIISDKLTSKALRPG